MESLLKSYDERMDRVDVKCLMRTINTDHRNAVLRWLMESLDLLKIEDRVYFSTLLLADKYCAKITGRWDVRYEGSELQLVLLSSLCCALKTTECSLELSIKSFLEHVSGGHVTCKDIFTAETRLLQILDFDVFAPSVAVFLEAYFFDLVKEHLKIEGLASQGPPCPMEQKPVDKSTLPPWTQQQYYISLFLLYLFSLDVGLFHSFRHPSVLVSACILTAAFNFQLAEVQHEFPATIAKLTKLGFIDPRRDNIDALVRETNNLWVAKLELAEEDSSIAGVKKLFDSEKRMYASKIIPRQIRPFGASGG